MWILILICFFPLTGSKNPTYFCVDKRQTTVEVEPNRIIFFETVNFPNGGYLNQTTSYCTMTFHLQEDSPNKTFVIFVTNPVLPPDYPFLGVTVSHDQDIISWNNWYLPHFEFQGFAFHDESNDDLCILESLTQKSPFTFDDGSQILYIRSSYSQITQRNRTCQWQFSAPKDYGFKIVITEWVVSSDIEFYVKNSSDYFIVNQESIKRNKPYYNGDTTLNIYLSGSNFTFFNVIEFGAYITIVKSKFKTINTNCTVTVISDKYQIWTSTNYLNPNGYANNGYCDFELEILPDTIVAAARNDKWHQVESYVDTIKYYDEISEEFISFDFLEKYESPRDKFQAAFLPYSNGTAKKIKWRFESDGSVTNEGFEVDFYTIDCYCASPIWIVPCKGVSNYHVTNTSQQGSLWDAYCANLMCNFTIQLNSSCPTKFIKFSTDHNLDEPHIYDHVSNDTFRLISGNTTIFRSDISTRLVLNGPLIISPKATIIFEALITDPDIANLRIISIHLAAVDEPKFQHKPGILTKYKPYFLLDTTYIFGECITVEIEPTKQLENVSIYVHGSALIEEFFYADKNLTQLIKYECLRDDECKTSVAKIFVCAFRSTPKLLLFHIVPERLFGGCVFHHLPQIISFYAASVQTLAYSALAGPNDSCKIFLIQSGPGFYVYTGYESEALLFEFNQETANIWQNFIMYADFYLFEIPVNSSLIFWTNSTSLEFIDYNYAYYVIPLYEHQMIAHTPHYKYLPSNGEFVACFANYTIGLEIFVLFTVIYYDVSPFMSFKFYANGVLQNINKVGTSLAYTNANITLCYSPKTTLKEKLIPNEPAAIFFMEVKLTDKTGNKSVTTTWKNIYDVY